jgi:hypothetical protein
MSQREVAIVGRNNTKAAVTGQEELLVKVNAYGAGSTLAPTILRSTSSATIPANKGFSVANVGSADGTVGGTTIKPGEIISFDSGVNTIGVINFDATGTEFLVTYLTA